MRRTFELGQMAAARATSRGANRPFSSRSLSIFTPSELDLSSAARRLGLDHVHVDHLRRQLGELELGPLSPPLVRTPKCASGRAAPRCMRTEYVAGCAGRQHTRTNQASTRKNPGFTSVCGPQLSQWHTPS